MKLAHLALVVALSALTAFGVMKFAATTAAVEKKETAFERVMRTGTLRCGYYNFAPIFTINPNTKEPTGFAVDLMKTIEKRTGLKVEWTEEITFGNWIPAILANKFDTVCTPLWADASYARAVHFTQPMFFADIAPLIRMDETRFSQDSSIFNDPSITIAVQESHLSQELAETQFPKAKKLSSPSNADYGTVLENVIRHKADVTFWSRAGFKGYEKNNEGKLRVLDLNKPLKVIPVEMPVLRGETAFLAFLDDVLEDIILSGAMGELIDKWAVPKGTWFKCTPPYTHPTQGNNL